MNKQNNPAPNGPAKKNVGMIVVCAIIGALVGACGMFALNAVTHIFPGGANGGAICGGLGGGIGGGIGQLIGNLIFGRK